MVYYFFHFGRYLIFSSVHHLAEKVTSILGLCAHCTLCLMKSQDYFVDF